MEIELWYKEQKEKAKTTRRKKQVEWIYKTGMRDYSSGIDEDIWGKVKALECDDGVLIASIQRTGGEDRIHHYLVTGSGDEANIRERGLEDWPRGRTRVLDSLCDAIDGELLGDEGAAWDRHLDKFGSIRAERKRQQESAPRKSRRRRRAR